MLNYKLQNNMSEMGYNGRDFPNRSDIFNETGIKNNVFYGNDTEIDNDGNEQLLTRKKAWADLDKQYDDVKSNMKTLMRRNPEHTDSGAHILGEK